MEKRKLLKRLREELKGSTENMEYQRDNTKNRATTAFWEGAMFAENMIIEIIKKEF